MYDENSIDSIYNYALKLKDKTLSMYLNQQEQIEVEAELAKQKGRRKGLLGNLIEAYFFNMPINSRSTADFEKAGLELKVSPLKTHAKKGFVAKERLVFSMIDYDKVVNEMWETSSFLQKNSRILLLMYLYETDKSLDKYTFKVVQLLDMLHGFSKADLYQIKSDWETIVSKIKQGKAHLLSEADTAYLSASTKSSDSSKRRHQPNSSELAKPRAFSFKSSFLNTIVHQSLYDNSDTLCEQNEELTIEEVVQRKFSPFLHQNEHTIMQHFEIKQAKKSKNFYRMLAHRMLGVKTKQIQELEKANITLKVIVLEPNGTLLESISFPAFSYREIINQRFETSDLYEQLSTKKFLFVVFRKTLDASTQFIQARFWNFPLEDLSKVQTVWELTVQRIKEGQADNLPKLSDNSIVHVRPHARDSKDTLLTPCGKHVVKKSFWLNASYIQTIF